MSAKHTPGPWIVQESDFGASEFVITTHRRQNESVVPICKIDIYFDGRIGIEQKANARLIAAAPDLLRALSDLIETITTPYTSEVETRLAIKDAKIEISKATGEN